MNDKLLLFQRKTSEREKNVYGTCEGSLQATENINYKARSHLHLNEKQSQRDTGAGEGMSEACNLLRCENQMS